jgi:methionine-S-sulfoxide reductase
MKKDFAVFAAGCFWGVQFFFDKTYGVLSTSVGYTGGFVDNPTYEQIKNGNTGHYEAALVVFDSHKTNYETLARLFFEIHDFTQKNGQGPDIGNQYKSAIFFNSIHQRDIAFDLINILRQKGFDVATDIIKFQKFWTAEAYHQNYYQKNNALPYCHFKRKIF